LPRRISRPENRRHFWDAEIMPLVVAGRATRGGGRKPLKKGLERDIADFADDPLATCCFEARRIFREARRINRDGLLPRHAVPLRRWSCEPMPDAMPGLVDDVHALAERPPSRGEPRHGLHLAEIEPQLVQPLAEQPDRVLASGADGIERRTASIWPCRRVGMGPEQSTGTSSGSGALWSSCRALRRRTASWRSISARSLRSAAVVRSTSASVSAVMAPPRLEWNEA
jgi:hypothetical protein